MLSVCLNEIIEREFTSMKQVIIGILAVVAIIGGAVVFGKDDQTASGAPSNNFYGPEESSVTLVEYGDFECPACAAFHPLVSQLKEEYKDQVRFEFRHYPLVQIHFNAQAAHRAAQAAANQGKFWEMHDLLYERQSSWRADVQSSGAHGGPVASNNNPGPIFEGYAEEIGLDIEQFKADVVAGETLATINADVERANADGATSTPTFVLNGKKIDDTSTVDTIEEFRALLDAEIAAATGEQNDSSDESSPESNDETTTENGDESTEADSSEPEN